MVGVHMIDVYDWVTLRLARVYLRQLGSAPHDRLLDDTLRAALLVDLAQRGALSSGPAGVSVDTGSTGFAPADQLLAGIDAVPDRTIEWWLRRGSVGLRQIGAVLVDAGIWQRHRLLWGFTELHTGEVDGEIAHLHKTRTVSQSPATVALAALRGTLLPIDSKLRAPAGGFVDHVGDAGWLLGDLLDYLERRHRLLAAAAADARLASTANFIT